MSAESSRLKEEVSSFHELEAYVKEFKAASPKSKVVAYLDELRSCLSKEEDQRNIRTASEQLYNTFPVEKQYDVKHFLKVLVFQQDKKLSMPPKLTGRGKSKSSPTTTSTAYTQRGLPTGSLSAKQVGSGTQGNSQMNPDTATQWVSSDVPVADSTYKIAVWFSKAIECLKSAVKKDNYQFQWPKDRPGTFTKGFENLEFIRSTLEKGPKRAQEPVAGSGEIDRSHEVLQWGKRLRSTAAFDMSEASRGLPRQHPGLEILTNVNELKDENKSMAEGKDKTIKELEDKGKADKDHIEKLQQDTNELKNDLQEREHSFRKYIQDEQTKYSQLQKAYEDLEREKKKIQSYSEDMQQQTAKIAQKLQKSIEKNDKLNADLVQQAEEGARQKYKLSEEVHRLHADNKQLKSSKTIKELEDKGKADKDHIEKLQQDTNELKKDMQEREHSFKKYIQDEQTKYSQLQKAYEDLEREKKKIQSYSEDMQQQTAKIAQKLQKSIEKNDKLNADLVQQAEEGARQKYKLSEEVHRLHADNKQLKSSKKIKELEEKGKADKDHIEKLQQDANELIKDMEEMEHSFKKYIQDEQTNYSQLRKAYEDFEREKKKIQCYSEDMLQQASKLAQKLQKSIGKNDKLNADLVQQAEEGARQKYKLSEGVHSSHAENKQSRVNEVAGAKLMDNNPDIADLSDPNRALKLGERFSCLYDDTWTDIIQLFTEKFKMTEEDAIKMLLQIVERAYDFCRKVADEQMDCLCYIFGTPCQDIPKALTMKPQKPQMTQKQHKELKDLRKKIAWNQADAISKQYLNKEYEELKTGDKQQKKMLDETKIYYEKCAEVCWPMVLHDPPVRMALEAQPGAKIDMNRFRLYGGNGDTLEYIVWPALFVEGGGFVTKGVAKPKKVPCTVKKP